MPTSTLADGRARIVALLDGLAQRGPHDPIIDVIDAVTSQLACERAALSLLHARGDADVHAHAIEHARARFALFRLATEPHASTPFRQAVSDLRAAFGDGPLSLPLAVAEQLDAREQAVLHRHILAMTSRLNDSTSAAREVVRAVERCALASSALGFSALAS
jgi:hypothetical protein